MTIAWVLVLLAIVLLMFGGMAVFLDIIEDIDEDEDDD